MSIEASVENQSRKLTTAFVSPAGTETTRAWRNCTLPAPPHERKDETMRHVSLGLEESMNDLQVRRAAKEDET